MSSRRFPVSLRARNRGSSLPKAAPGAQSRRAVLPLLAAFLFACGGAGPLPGDGGAAADGGLAGWDGGSGPDGGAPDAGVQGADGGSGPSLPARYPADALLSPITESVASVLRGIAGRSDLPDPQVFMKVGASGTVSSNFLRCFAGIPGSPYALDLDGRAELQPAIDHFRAGDAAGATPFDRVSLAAMSGRSAVWAISGSPSPLEQEIAAINPRIALVNYGTNDMQLGTTHRSALWPFFANFSSLLDQVMGRGIVPVVTGLNPRTDLTSARLWVPTYNALTRAMAEARQAS